MSVYKIKPSIKEQSTLFLKSCKYIKGHEDVQSHIDFLNSEKLLKKVELINTLLIPDESIIAYIGCNNLEMVICLACNQPCLPTKFSRMNIFLSLPE